jgi:ribose transport system permease protein
MEKMTNSGKLGSIKAIVSRGNLPIPALLSLLIVSAFTATRSPEFLTFDNFVQISDQASVTIILVCGLTFVILMGSIDLSVQGVMASASMATALLVGNDRNQNNWGYWSIPAGMVVGALIGLIAGLAVTRLRIPSFLVTMATWNIGLGLAYVLFGNTSQPSVKDKGMLALGLDTFLGFSKATWIALVVVLFCMWLQTRTKFGRYAYVIGGSEEIAKLSGINVKRFRALSLVLSGALSGLAGSVIVAKSGIGAVQAGEGQLFLGIAAVVIGGTLLSGGRGGILHSVVGVYIMITISVAMILLDVSDFYQQIVQGSVVLLVVSSTAWRQRRPLRTVV